MNDCMTLWVYIHIIISLAIPEINNVIKKDTSISLTWNLQVPDEVTQFEVECVSLRQLSHLLVDNETFYAHISGLLLSTPYNCCVSANFDDHKTQSCTSITTDMLSTQNDSSANTVGGVLGFIIIILLLLLTVAIVALLYPCVIRPKAKKSKTLTR